MTQRARGAFPTEDGSEYVIERDAIDWELDTEHRLSHLVGAEMDKIGGPSHRKISRTDMMRCFLAALKTLVGETEKELSCIPVAVSEVEKGDNP